ncbi:MAG TPA: TOBE domain-containing protein [Methylococcaceae bacterium]|nr:TOBE domain-containing protein [Methylococcaceae bacterium]
MKLSIRNNWKGTVKSVSHGNIVSEVVLEIAPGVEVVSVISRHSAEALQLAPGKEAHALVKSSEVSIGVD